MQRKVEFYKIDYSFLPVQSFNKDKVELNNIFIKNLNDTRFKKDVYEIKYYEHNDSIVVIELLEINDEFIFGIIAKFEDLKNGPLKRLREKEGNEVLESELSKLGLQLENYTYFFLCKETLYCSVLSNSSAPKFKTHFQNFLSENIDMTYLKDINVNIVLDDHIERKLNKLQNLSKLDIIFNDTSNMGKSLLELKNTFGVSQSLLNRARVTIDLKLLPLSEDTRSIFTKLFKSKSEFEKLELTGFDQDENIIDMELVERILLKKVDINIDDNQLISSKDLEEIKKALEGSLIAI